MWFLENAWLIPVIPTLGYFVILLFGKRLPLKGAEIGVGTLGASFVLAAANPATGATLVVLSLLLNWFGDSLDGTVARVRNRQRPRYGYYVDHIVDIVGALALFAGLANSGGMQPVIALTLLVAYVAAMAEVFLATHVTHVFRLASFGFGPTELRLVLAVGALGTRLRLPTCPLPLAAGVRHRW